MKRAFLPIVGLAILAAAAASAGVKPAPDAKHPAQSPTAQGQPAAEHRPDAGDAGHQAAPADTASHAQGGHETPAAGHGSAAEQPGAGHGTAAAGHETAEHGGGHEAESPWATVARLFNFALLAGSLIYLLRSPFGAFLENRQVQIKKSLTDAAATRDEATHQLALIDQKLQALPGELKALKDRGAADIAAEEARIRQASDVERERMVANGKREIERRAQLAERHLVKRAGELAVSLATERVKRTITDADQARLVDRYLEQVRPETIGS